MRKKPSKAKRPHSSKASRALPPDQRSYAPWLQASRPDVDVHRDVLQRIGGGRFSAWPAEIEAMLAGLSESVVEVYWPRCASGRRMLDKQAAQALVLCAVREGYSAAMLDHSGDIVEADEAETLYQSRGQGVTLGHQIQSQLSDDRAQRIRDTWAAMEAAGQKVTNDTVAAAVGCSRSTVIRAFKSKPTRRAKR